MNPITKFYSVMLTYLENGSCAKEDRIEEIVALACKVKPSWKTSVDSIQLLEQCCIDAGSVEDEVLFSTRTDFAKAAFRDLSIQKDPVALELFRKIGVLLIPGFETGEDVLIWARSIEEMEDGSAVIVLHVSHMARFRKLMEDHDLVDTSTEGNSLEGVVQIGS